MMNGYFITILVLYSLSLGVDLVQHNTEKTGKNNFFVSLIGIVIQLTLIIMAIKTGF